MKEVAHCFRYYGENVLHMATTNEDPAMVKYLLDAGVNFQVEGKDKVKLKYKNEDKYK